MDVSGNAELTMVPMFAQQAAHTTQLRASNCCFGVLPEPDGLPTTLVSLDVRWGPPASLPACLQMGGSAAADWGCMHVMPRAPD